MSVIRLSVPLFYKQCPPATIH